MDERGERLEFAAAGEPARLRLGFLVATLLDSYQGQVLEGARDAALTRDVSLYCFVGGELGSPHPEVQRRNRLYDLVGPENVDALAVVVGSLGNRIGRADLAQFCARFSKVPLCTIAGEIPGVSSVVVDNRSGIREAVTHLVRVHGRRRIAFLRGPVENQDAEERFSAYVDALAELEIDFDENLVAPGDFSHESGVAAIELLFDQRKLGHDSVEAILAADDATAIGALSALDARGIRVPEQVAVIGFDDIEAARYTSPPLTTVRQPLREQGEAAARTLLSQARGSTVPSRVVLPTRIVCRRSCGCFAGEAGVAPHSTRSTASTSFEVQLLRRRDVIRAELSRAARGSFGHVKAGWEDLLITSFADQVRTESRRFHDVCSDLLNTLLASGVDVAPVQDVITVLRRHIVGCLDHQDATLRARAEDTFHEVRLAASDAIERGQARYRAATERAAYAVGQATKSLVADFSLANLNRAISEHFPSLGIQSCYVSLFDDPAGPTSAHLAVVRDDFVKAPASMASNILAFDTKSFPSRHLAPRGWLRPDKGRAFIVLPLESNEHPLGFVLMTFGKAPHYAYETLEGAMAATLRAVQAQL